MGSNPTRGSSFFLRKVTALDVVCCFALFVCLTLLASFFHLSFSIQCIQCSTVYTLCGEATCTCIQCIQCSTVYTLCGEATCTCIQCSTV